MEPPVWVIARHVSEAQHRLARQLGIGLRPLPVQHTQALPLAAVLPWWARAQQVLQPRLALSSQAGVRALARAQAAAGPPASAPQWASAMLYAVGPKTAEAIHEKLGPGLQVCVAPTAQALARRIRSLEPDPCTLVHLCALRPRPELALGLQGSVIQYAPLPVYETLAIGLPPEVVHQAFRHAHGVLVASPSAALLLFNSMCQVGLRPAEYAWVAIGATTARALASVGIWAQHPTQPTVEAMLEMAGGPLGQPC